MSFTVDLGTFICCYISRATAKSLHSDNHCPALGCNFFSSWFKLAFGATQIVLIKIFTLPPVRRCFHLELFRKCGEDVKGEQPTRSFSILPERPERGDVLAPSQIPGSRILMNRRVVGAPKRNLGRLAMF
jgi:hypothetical protein